MRTLPLLCALLSALAACSSPSAPARRNSGDPAEQLAQNQQQFHATVGDTYRVTFENHCFCPVEVLRPVRLTVRYFACHDEEGWCRAVTQSYTIDWTPDRDGGWSQGRGRARQRAAGERRP